MSSTTQLIIPRALDTVCDLVVGVSAIASIPEYIPAETHRVVVITDTVVEGLFASAVRRVLQAVGYTTDVLVFAAGEENKTQATKTMLEERMLELGCTRDTCIVALGGGVVGDMAGFVAATYMRGIAYLQVPTTVLAMVDSSIGGKTGIDTPYGKNLIGAFHHPRAIIMDMSTIAQLPRDELVHGLVEAIKTFVVADAEMFAYVEKHLDDILNRDMTALERVIARAGRIKGDIVAADEKEANERMLVNAGHTVGHALEKASGFSLPHGRAVALGLMVELRYSAAQGCISQEASDRVAALFARLGISLDELADYDESAVADAMRLDKKRRNGEVCTVMYEDIGRPLRRGGRVAHPVSSVALVGYCKM